MSQQNFPCLSFPSLSLFPGTGVMHWEFSYLLGSKECCSSGSSLYVTREKSKPWEQFEVLHSPPVSTLWSQWSCQQRLETRSDLPKDAGKPH